MTTLRIDLPDHQVATLKAKAAAQRLSIEEWFRALATKESLPLKGRYALTELMEQCDSHAPLSSEDIEWMEAPSTGREAL